MPSGNNIPNNRVSEKNGKDDKKKDGFKLGQKDDAKPKPQKEKCGC